MDPSQSYTGSLQPDELEAVYAISRVVANHFEIDAALAEIVGLSRPVFIFDNAVLYLQNPDADELEPAFARAIGRGRVPEAEISWGQKAAQEAFSTGKIFLSEAEIKGNTSRLEQAFYLGMPLSVGGHIIGALVFIRFGGPSYAKEQINLAEFIAAHVSQVLEHRRLVSQVARLEAEKQLAQLQSDFLATVSHELKTPLGFIKGYSSTLLRDKTDWSDEERKEFLEVIDDESNRMSELVDNLLDSSRLQSDSLPMIFSEFNLATMLEEVRDRIEIQHPEIQIRLVDLPDEINVDADAKRIAQVLNNIISNAIKYAPGSPVHIRVAEKAGEIEIEIRDEGAGISDEHMESIFERFYRIPDKQRSVRGSGLGLYISKQIVEAHNGEIKVRSGLGQGTSFTICLPNQTEGKKSQGSTTMKQILVVDDEARFTRLVEANLSSEGYQVSTGANGKDAVEMTASSKPDLVLLDVMMPEYDGFEACTHIRSFSNVPIIMLTAKGEEEDRIRGLDAGADDYIVKPFSANELLARVRAVLRRAEIGGSEPKESHLKIGEIEIDLAQAIVSVRGEKVGLSATEYRLLLQLARNAGEVQKAEDLLMSVWGEEYSDEKEILWVSISRLRQKLEENPKRAKIILTRPSEGYLIATH